jgi:anti-anti-sigma factor
VNQATSQEEPLRLQGDLTLSTVADIYAEFTARLARAQGQPAVDMQATGRIDSAGLALLLEWQALARKRGSKLSLLHVPKELLHLARLCEATDLLELAEDGNGDKHAATGS